MFEHITETTHEGSKFILFRYHGSLYGEELENQLVVFADSSIFDSPIIYDGVVESVDRILNQDQIHHNSYTPSTCISCERTDEEKSWPAQFVIYNEDSPSGAHKLSLQKELDICNSCFEQLFSKLSTVISEDFSDYIAAEGL